MRVTTVRVPCLSIQSVKSTFSKRLCRFKNCTGVWRSGKKFGNSSSETIKANFKRISLGGSGHEFDAISTFQLKSHHTARKNQSRLLQDEKSNMKNKCNGCRLRNTKLFCSEMNCHRYFLPLLPAFYLCSPSGCSHFSVVLFVVVNAEGKKKVQRRKFACFRKQGNIAKANLMVTYRQQKNK